MFKKKYKPYFDNKTCDICGQRAVMFRCIEDKSYMLCSNKQCSLIIKRRHNWGNPFKL